MRKENPEKNRSRYKRRSEAASTGKILYSKSYVFVTLSKLSDCLTTSLRLFYKEQIPVNLLAQIRVP